MKQFIRLLACTLFSLTTLLTGCATPELFYAFDHPVKSSPWSLTMARWQQSARVCEEHTKGLSGLGVDAFAQSFKPHCSVIKAVQINLYPVKAAGWLRLELARNEYGLPGRVLARSWLRVEPDCPVPLRGYMTFLLGNIYVEPDDTYWITVVEFPDADYLKYSITNLGFQENSDVPNQELLRRERYSLIGLRTANFRIVSSFDGLPGIHNITTSEKQTLPSVVLRNASWLNARQEYLEAMRHACDADAEGEGATSAQCPDVPDDPVEHSFILGNQKAPRKVTQIVGEVVAIDIAAWTFIVKERMGDVTITANGDTVVTMRREKKELTDIALGDTINIWYFEASGKKLAQKILIKPKPSSIYLPSVARPDMGDKD